MDEVLLILFGIAWAIGTPIIAIVALVRTRRLRDQNAPAGRDRGARRQMASRARRLAARAA